jgi:hypothetical protein
MKKQKITLIAVSAVLMVAFQNCAQMNFAPATDVLAESTSPNGDSLGQTDVNQDNNGNNAGATPTPAPTATPPVVDLADAKPFSCKVFTEITYNPAATLNIPKRDSNSGECFVMKIVSKAIFQKSATNPNQDNDVVSRDHATNTSNHHPFVLGNAMVRMRLGGERAIKLSGGKNDTANILVDNFLLIGIAATSQIGDPQYYKAYGTSDSSAIGYQGVLFKDVTIPVTAFATGGTSTIKPLSLAGQIEIDRDYTLDVRALDAGSYGEVSDIYMLFQ